MSLDVIIDSTFYPPPTIPIRAEPFFPQVGYLFFDVTCNGLRISPSTSSTLFCVLPTTLYFFSILSRERFSWFIAVGAS